MSWRDDHAGLMCFARARDRNHSRSSGEGSMCAQNTSEQVRTRQAAQKRQTVLSRKMLKPLSDRVINHFLSVLMQYAA